MTRRVQLAYKGNRCAVCGLSVDEMIQRYGTFKRMTEFHHVVPSKKSPAYPALIQRKICTEQLNELDKCVLLCRQCHGVIHAQDITCKLTVIMSVGEDKYTQQLNGQCVLDRITKKLHFVSDERFKLGQYVVKLGSEPPLRMVGVEMDDENFFTNIFRRISGLGSVTIWDDREKEPQFRIECLDNGDYRLQQSFKFPFLTLESTDDLTKFWVRGGMYLDESGKILGDGKIDTVFSFDHLT